MAELPRSPLPHEPEYWARLEQAIRADAAGPLAQYAAAHEVWYGVLARRAPWLVAATAAAMLMLWLVAARPDASTDLRWLESSLVPEEEVGTLLGGAAPPSVEELMVLVQLPPELDEEEPP